MLADTAAWVLIAAPSLPVVVGFLLTAWKLSKQDVKVEEVHQLVNGQRARSLKEIIDLRQQLNLPVEDLERELNDLLASL